MTGPPNADASPEWLDEDALPNPSDLRRFAVYAQHGDGPALHVATGTLYPDGHVTARLADGTPPSSFVDVATLRRMCQMAVAGDAYASVDVWLDFEDPEWGDDRAAAGPTTPASGRGPDEVWRGQRERRREVHGGDRA